MQDQTIPVTDTRIITEATVPLYLSSPKKLLALAGGLLLGMFAGAGAGLGRELLKDVFRATSDVEQSTGITCLGVLPTLNLKHRGRGLVTAWAERSSGQDRSRCDHRRDGIGAALFSVLPRLCVT